MARNSIERNEAKNQPGIRESGVRNRADGQSTGNRQHKYGVVVDVRPVRRGNIKKNPYDLSYEGIYGK
jgi:hypothetical protein